MTTDSRVGRPRASSRETLAEAACELFLEQGFDSTTIAEIARRAGVSRSSFFNYFASKSAVLWSGLDERIDRLEDELAGESDAAAVSAAFDRLARGFAPDSLALAIVNEATMGVRDELAREAALRSARVAAVVAPVFEAAGVARLEADVRAAGWGGALLAAVAAWARDGAGRVELEAFVRRAVQVAARP
ncbi:TetR/AcrR family transcriptional regulator [Microbacterium radiodurans]|uniref:TetR family transcriptional regulator n=1 Tax=Microbacterium radiodurans TaxID=661398 RepID=A0A5J5IV65_9MICO|nr:TetR/AcrR family transcriptional regulator [Microbacterium radiodurans]KAA9086902.1 TetR family transcriptional regulator [Microbacterium radiodurans]